MSTETASTTTEKPQVTAKELLVTRLFTGEDEEKLNILLATCQTKWLGVNDVLFKPGQTNSCLYIVVSGRLAVKLTHENDELLDYVDKGSCVGEMSVLEGLPVSTYVTADQPTQLLVIEDTQMWELINHSKVVAKNLLLILSSRVRSGHKSVSESLQAQRAIEHDAKIDSLTGLYNRRWLNEAFPRWTNRKETLSIMMLDIDYFKQYNDNHGHLGGDTALKSVAEKLMQELRPTDLAARYGGEEFITLLPRASFTETKEIAERIRIAIRQHTIVDNNNQSLPSVTISIGIAELTEGQDHIELLAKADAALYRAKNNGRDQVSA